MALRSRTRAGRPRTRLVPLARRQLLHEPLKLALALAGVTLAVALVGLLFGLREGIRHQVTTFVDNAGQLEQASDCTGNDQFSFPLTFPRSRDLALRLAFCPKRRGLENR